LSSYSSGVTGKSRHRPYRNRRAKLSRAQRSLKSRVFSALSDIIVKFALR
jgi:hypothetical protein